jgi:hypothetical protein
MFTHWTGSRSVRCYPGACEPCKKHNRQIWKGYIAVEQWRHKERDWKPWALEVTEHLEVQLRNRNLLGEVWEICRKKREGKKPMPVEGTHLGTHSADQLRTDVDVTVVLRWLYGEAVYSLDEPNPLPSKQYLDTRKGEAPPAAPSRAEQDRQQREEAARTYREKGTLAERAERLRRSQGQGDNGQGDNGQGHNGQGDNGQGEHK